jgi:predicted GNAT family N-acyltransferase
MIYLTTLLNSSHKKGEFSCGQPSLDNYLYKQAGQDMDRMLAAVFVMTESELIKGYYSLSSNSIKRDLVPEIILKKLPKSYNDLPTTLLGRLAIDIRFKGQGLGKLLLIDALKRSYDNSKTSSGSMAVVVDPLDEEAEKFYRKFGFLALPDSKKMFIAMKTVRQLFY